MTTVSFEGPFNEWRVVVDGHEVPHLTAHMEDGGRVVLVCDHAVAISLPVERIEEFIGFVDFAMRVAIRGARWTPVHKVTAIQADGEVAT